MSTFRASNFKEVLAENPTFREYFYALGKEMLENSLKASSRIVTPDITEPEVLESLVSEEEAADECIED